MLFDSKPQASVDSKGIAEPMIEATETVDSGRCIRLRVVLAKHFKIQARTLLEMVTKSEGLLATVAAAFPGLTIRLNQRAIENYIQNAVSAVVMIHEQNDLLPKSLKRLAQVDDIFPRGLQISRRPGWYRLHEKFRRYSLRG